MTGEPLGLLSKKNCTEYGGVPPATVVVPATGVRLSTVVLSAGAVRLKAMGSATRKELVSEFVVASKLSVATE